MKATITVVWFISRAGGIKASAPFCVWVCLSYMGRLDSEVTIKQIKSQGHMTLGVHEIMEKTTCRLGDCAPSVGPEQASNILRLNTSIVKISLNSFSGQS
jgi:hypothetical protein